MGHHLPPLISIFSAVLIHHHLTAKKDDVKYNDYSIKVDKILLFGDKQQYVVGLDKKRSRYWSRANSKLSGISGA